MEPPEAGVGPGTALVVFGCEDFVTVWRRLRDREQVPFLAVGVCQLQRR
jgi:hypothetical protein